ncbi:MAG: hypothetical protein Q9227_003952 [Pyrenula ochraceoflavens]
MNSSETFTSSNASVEFHYGPQHYVPRAKFNSSFAPIPELYLEDAAITLFFLSADNVNYVKKVDDEWYSAHQRTGMISWEGDSTQILPLYSEDRAANVLACTSKFQVIDVLTVDALQARENFQAGTGGPVSPDQWKRELMYWETIALGVLQQFTVDLATGPRDDTLQKYVHKTLPNSSGNQSCIPQKVRSTAYTSFNVLGLSITISLGGMIILLSYLIEPLCDFVQRRRKNTAYCQLEWVANETLQLQRMVHQEVGLGTWTGSLVGIPVTSYGEELGVLKALDEKLSVMVRQPKTKILDGGYLEAAGPPSTQATIQRPFAKDGVLALPNAKSEPLNGRSQRETTLPQIKAAARSVKSGSNSSGVSLPATNISNGNVMLSDSDKGPSTNKPCENLSEGRGISS